MLFFQSEEVDGETPKKVRVTNLNKLAPN